MKTAIPWALLGVLVLYRHTWGAKTAEEVDALRRRLACAHRETKDWQQEARMYQTLWENHR